MARTRRDDKKRKLFATRLEDDLIWELKEIATLDREDMYLAVERALKEYIQRRKESAQRSKDKE
jgi:predicted transcriptional regulator